MGSSTHLKMSKWQKADHNLIQETLCTYKTIMLNPFILVPAPEIQNLSLVYNLYSEKKYISQVKRMWLTFIPLLFFHRNFSIFSQLASPITLYICETLCIESEWALRPPNNKSERI